MNWTIACSGVEKLVGDWGFEGLTRKLVSQGADDLTFTAPGAPADGAMLFTPFVSTITLWRDRQIDSSGNFSGGTPWFQGLVIQVPRAGNEASESMQYKAVGPWWYLDNRVYHNAYQNIFLGYEVAGDPTTPPQFGTGSTTHLFLGQGVSGSALTLLNTAQQINDALVWALKPFTDADLPGPFQIGAITPAIQMPIDEVRDITCAEVIRKMLRWVPDAVTWFDYTTTPPTFNCKRRAELKAVTLDISAT